MKTSYRRLVAYCIILCLCAAFPIAIFSIDDGNPCDDASISRHFSEAVSSLPSAFPDLSQIFTTISYCLIFSLILPQIALIRALSRAPPK
jgi:hypothetical protein